MSKRNDKANSEYCFQIPTYFWIHNYTHSCSHLSRFDLPASFCKLFPQGAPNFGCYAVDFVSLLRRGRGVVLHERTWKVKCRKLPRLYGGGYIIHIYIELCRECSLWDNLVWHTCASVLTCRVYKSVKVQQCVRNLCYLAPCTNLGRAVCPN